jgi:xylulokinase
MKDLLMGIDLGTSGCKIAVFDISGNVISTQTQSYEVYYPKAGWAEQNPDEWWDAICKGLKSVLSSVDAGRIAGIGVDGQSWSAIPVDEQGTVLANTPIWTDTRAGEECEELERSIGKEEIFALCGNPLSPSYTLPKILWFKRHYPEIYSNTYKFMQSNSFINLRLTGEFTQDISQGYGLHCFDIQHGGWNERMCTRMGISPELLPKIYNCHDIIGKVTAKAASQTGLAEGTPVVAGGLDAACGTLGVGVINSGDTQEQGGQAGGMSICTADCKAEENLILSYHVVPNLWLLQGGTVGGGGVMRWIEQELGDAERYESKSSGTSSLALLDAKAEKINAGSDGVVFLPYMRGERSPIWDIHAKGVFFGLDFAKTKSHMIRAAMEGVAYSLRHNLETAQKTGAKADILYSMGGAANSRLWTQIKADITGKKIHVPCSDNASSLGAAILAGVGTGVYKNFEDAREKTFKITKTYEPDTSKEKVYEKGYQIYRALYDNLKATMKFSDEGEQ